MIGQNVSCSGSIIFTKMDYCGTINIINNNLYYGGDFVESKQKIKYFINGVVMTLVLVLSTATFASGRIEKVLNVLYNDIKVAVDGKIIDLGKDSSGKGIEPFIYQGTTYLPIRAVGEALNQPVDWDSKTKTVLVGKGALEKEMHLMDEKIDFGDSWISKYSTSGNGFKMGGNHYKSGVTFRTTDAIIQYNLNSKYSSIKGELGALSYWDKDSIIEIHLDGKLHEKIYVSSSDVPKQINIPVKNVNHLLIKRVYNPDGAGAEVGFGDILVK